MNGDTLDRVLRGLSRSAETRDIIRALLRHLPAGATSISASDEDIGYWAGIDQANVGRRVREDAAFRGRRVSIQRGRAPAFGAPAAPTTYDLAKLLEHIAAQEARDQQPPSESLVGIKLDEWAFEAGVRISPIRQQVVREALADVAARLQRPLVLRDLQRVVDRAIELARVQPPPPQPQTNWTFDINESSPPGRMRFPGRRRGE